MVAPDAGRTGEDIPGEVDGIGTGAPPPTRVDTAVLGAGLAAGGDTGRDPRPDFVLSGGTSR